MYCLPPSNEIRHRCDISLRVVDLSAAWIRPLVLRHWDMDDMLHCKQTRAPADRSTDKALKKCFSPLLETSESTLGKRWGKNPGKKRGKFREKIFFALFPGETQYGELQKAALKKSRGIISRPLFGPTFGPVSRPVFGPTFEPTFGPLLRPIFGRVCFGTHQ